MRPRRLLALDPGEQTGAVYAHWQRELLSGVSLTIPLAQLSTWLELVRALQPDLVLIERMPARVPLSLLTEYCCLRAFQETPTEIRRVLPGVWKPWLTKQPLPSSWRTRIPWRTTHEHDALKLLWWWHCTIAPIS